LFVFLHLKRQTAKNDLICGNKRNQETDLGKKLAKMFAIKINKMFLLAIVVVKKECTTTLRQCNF
jgi:hypothetical protein